MTKSRIIKLNYRLNLSDDKYDEEYEHYIINRIHVSSIIEETWTKGYDVKIVDDSDNCGIIIYDINRKPSFEELHKIKQELSELFDSKCGYGVDYCHKCDRHTPFEYDPESYLNLVSFCSCGTRRVRSFFSKELAEEMGYGSN